ncbi:transcriptional activator NhaR [Leucothrix sargassi]|nr:transcriptional activator NhaR [Leucothrix sargassi]
MKQINYHHLQYFHAVAHANSISGAAAALNVTPQTVSGQLTTFEQYIGAKLFDRNGKNFELTELGKLTLHYADDIFNLGNELSRALSLQDPELVTNFAVGVTDALPKVMVYDILEDCFAGKEQFVLACHEGNFNSLLSDLSINKLDLVISDQPLPTGLSVRARNHFLGGSGMTFFAHVDQAHLYQENFPQSLNNQPFMMPGKQSALHNHLSSWFRRTDITPRVIAEFDDSALLKFFGQSGRGIFCIASCVENDILSRFDVAVIGRTDDVSENYYAVIPERKVQHPALDRVINAATQLFEQ